MPIGLSDTELRLIMSAATSIKYERRSDFLIAVARELGGDHQTIGEAITHARTRCVIVNWKRPDAPNNGGG